MFIIAAAELVHIFTFSSDCAAQSVTMFQRALTRQLIHISSSDITSDKVKQRTFPLTNSCHAATWILFPFPARCTWSGWTGGGTAVACFPLTAWSSQHCFHTFQT